MLDAMSQDLEVTYAKKDSFDDAKYSTDTLSREAESELIAKSFSGVLGLLVSFNAIRDIFGNINAGKKNIWIYLKTILDFTTSGILIGYALNNTFAGLLVGIVTGCVCLIIQKIMIKKHISKNQ